MIQRLRALLARRVEDKVEGRVGERVEEDCFRFCARICKTRRREIPHICAISLRRHPFSLSAMHRRAVSLAGVGSGLAGKSSASPQN